MPSIVWFGQAYIAALRSCCQISSPSYQFNSLNFDSEKISATTLWDHLNCICDIICISPLITDTQTKSAQIIGKWAVALQVPFLMTWAWTGNDTDGQTLPSTLFPGNVMLCGRLPFLLGNVISRRVYRVTQFQYYCIALNGDGGTDRN